MRHDWTRRRPPTPDNEEFHEQLKKHLTVNLEICNLFTCSRNGFIQNRELFRRQVKSCLDVVVWSLHLFLSGLSLWR